MLCNSVGTIDNEYRGEIMVSLRLTRSKDKAKIYQIGDKFAQIVLEKVEPTVVWQEVEELSESIRGDGGHGSSGK
jgi:dUTP pyrophosphatase